ncbi:MAG: AMP-binding protein [Actinomycetia bacterium]|nr:AMP-binding protein [Actinomycetes bacterium]
MSYVSADTTQAVFETTVGSILREAAADSPDALALVEGIDDASSRRTWTFSQLLTDAEKVARALAHRFDKGDRVAVWAPNIAEWVLMEYGCALAGVVLVTVNPAYQAQELKYVLEQSRSLGVFYLPSFRGNNMQQHVDSILPDLPHLREVVPFTEFDEFVAATPDGVELPEVTPDDPVQIQYTSGTTGFPKGAYLHHRGITNNARYIVDRLGLEAGGVYVNPMPLFHTGGCVLGVLGPIQSRAALVQLEAFDPGLMLELIETYGATLTLGVPTMLIALMEHPDFDSRDLSSITTVCSGGATVPADLVRRIEGTLGVQLSIVYGQTEASPGITLMRLDDSPEDKANTLGPALPQTEMKVVDPTTGKTVPYGIQGELCVRGYLVMLGYFEMEEKTAETIDAEGWLHTGDLVTMDDRGYTTITGRLKDMIIRGGENIYPREIEELLFEHPKVADVAVCGLPDEKWGEVVAAFIRDTDPAEPATDADLHAYLRDNLSPQKTPKIWYHLNDFPLTASGKIQKFAIVDAWKKGLYDASP